MLFPESSAPEPKAAQLVSLCCSLNSPVVSIPELPVGPASAAIAVHTDAEKACHITVAVQCRRTTGVVLFRASGELGDVDGRAAGAALLWAESLGFLFDEELCTDPQIEKPVRNESATKIWRALVADTQLATADVEQPTSPVEPDEAAILSKFRFAIDASPRSSPVSTGSEAPVGAITSTDPTTAQPSSMAVAIA